MTSFPAAAGAGRPTVATTGRPARRRPRTGRAAEFWLLIFAAVIVTSALVIVELNQNRSLSWTLAYYGGGYLAALAIAHLLVRRYAPYADPLLLPIVALLNGIGLVMIYRLDLARRSPRSTAARRSRPPQASLQLVWTAVALVFFLVVLLVDPRPHRAAVLRLHPGAGRGDLPGHPGRAAGQPVRGQRRADLDQGARACSPSSRPSSPRSR